MLAQETHSYGGNRKWSAETTAKHHPQFRHREISRRYAYAFFLSQFLTDNFSLPQFSFQISRLNSFPWNCEERRVVTLRKQIETLKSELSVANAELEKAKRCKELVEQELKGFELHLFLSEASVQTLEVSSLLVTYIVVH